MASRLETSENVSSMYLRANFEHIHPELASAELAAISGYKMRLNVEALRILTFHIV